MKIKIKNQEIKDLTTDLNKVSEKLTAQLSNHTQNINVDDLNADEALNMAKAIQKEDLNHLDNAIAQVDDCKQMGQVISLQLDKQNEQLDHCIEMMDEMSSTLDIANKELGEIASRLAKDRIIMVLIIVCVVVIIGTAVLFVLKDKILG